jgi:hypothetical protein
MITDKEVTIISEWVIDNHKRIRELVRPIGREYKRVLKNVDKILHSDVKDQAERAMRLVIAIEIASSTGLSTDAIIETLEDVDLTRLGV